MHRSRLCLCRSGTQAPVVPGNTFVETTGSRLANDGVPGVKKQTEELLKAGGGVMFIDEAYQLTGEHNFAGRQVLDFLLAEMENNVGKIVYSFAGYAREMEKFFEHNPGLPSRVPYTLRFEDYTDEELMNIFDALIEKKFEGRMKVSDRDGIRGLYGRIAIRRLGRGRGRPGFGNARALQLLFDRIRERQARRLTKERREGKRPDDLLLVKEDLIGPDPAEAMAESDAYKKLQTMIGLASVKQTVDGLVEMIKLNYQRELKELEPHQISLNRVFLGNPGTGKTTIAKLYGRILADLGLLSSGEVVVKNPADFIGSVLGQSESQTKAILSNAVGKVLVIDEAYMLYGRSGTGGTADPYKTAVIDTIVAEVQSVPGEDRCLLMLGYKEPMEEMFRNVNEGLSRRFAIRDAFMFEDYSDDELMQALDMKLKTQDLKATPEAKKVAIDVLSRARAQSNFGNIGEVENLLSKAKVHYQKRQRVLPVSERSPDAPFEPADFDPDFDRGSHASENLEKLFADVVGCEDIIQMLSGYQTIARNIKARGKKDLREYVPTNFIFKGPPGTGKTTTARKMGDVYYDMGMLGSSEVVECSASDLVGQYVGHTGPKVREQFERALGRVLFVDEAYRLGEGHFAKEAMDEIVTLATEERFRGKLICVLAGYNDEMDALLSVNSGLKSRFPNQVLFRNLTSEEGLEILRRKLQKDDVTVPALCDPSSPYFLEMSNTLDALSRLPGWGNARDCTVIAQRMTGHVLKTASNPDDTLLLNDAAALECMTSLLAERTASAGIMPPRTTSSGLPTLNPEPQAAPKMPTTRISQATEQAPPPPPVAIQEEEEDLSASGRDPGVSDAIWNQLQADKRAEEAAREIVEAAIRRALEEERRAVAEQEERDRALAELLENEQRARDDAERLELMRLREQARLRAAAAREERARKEAALKAQREAEAAARKEEQRVQAKIREMGVCVAGFRWIKQATGYRCSAGGHFLSNADLGI